MNPRAVLTRKKPSRLIIAGGAVLVGIVAILLFIVLSTVTKEDYAKAQTQYDKVAATITAYDAQMAKIVTVVKSGSDSDYQAEIDKLDQLATNLKDQNSTLGGMKALRFGDGNKHYDAFNEQIDKYVTFSKEVTASIKQGRPMFVACAEVSNATDVTNQIDTMNKCIGALGDVGTLPEKSMNTWTEGLKEKYQSYVDISTQIIKLTDPYGTQYEQYKTLRDKKYVVEEEISQVNATFAAAMDARDNEVSLKAPQEALKAYLTEQQK